MQPKTTQNPEIIKRMEDVINMTAPNYTCLRGPRPSGAVIITVSGYAIWGDVCPPANSPSCKDLGQCMMEDGHCVRNNHAEVDALLYCARCGFATEGATVYTINKPCYACTRAIIAAGISTVYYAFAVYDEERTRAIAEAAGLEMIHVPVSINV